MVKEFLILGSMVWILCSCASVERSNVDDLAKEATLKALAPLLEKVLLTESPIAPSSRSIYPTVAKLPGSPFDPAKDFNKPVALSKEHDALEKPARDAGVLEGVSLDERGQNLPVRNYTKNGGSDGLKRDFEAAPGKEVPTRDLGRRMKELPNGERIIARTHSEEGSPTLEFQPKDAGRGNKIRVKIRYK